MQTSKLNYSSGFKWNQCHAKVIGPLIDIHSNTLVFKVYVFKSLKFNQWICYTISLLFNLISITKILQAKHELKGLNFSVVMRLRLIWGKKKGKEKLFHCVLKVLCWWSLKSKEIKYWCLKMVNLCALMIYHVLKFNFYRMLYFLWF